MPQVGRNAPCPCGSGLKYKHCHGRPIEPPEVLYVHPAKQAPDTPIGPAPGRPYGLIPVGVAALANLLRADGITVQGVNVPLERGLDPAFDLHGWLAARRGAKLVLVDLHWYEHAYGALSVARAAKEALPGVYVVVGGITASAFADEVVQFAEVDVVVRGDAEQPLLALARRLVESGRGQALRLDDIPNLTYKRGEEIITTPLAYCATTADLDRLDFVNLDFLEHHSQYQAHEYVVTDLERARQALATSPYRGRWLCNARGCRYECSYCGGCRSAHRAVAGRQGVVVRSPQCMVEDLARLAAAGVVQASLSHDLTELGEAYWSSILEGTSRRGLRIGLYNEVYGIPPREFVEAFVQHVDMEHSCLALSPLSGSEAVRRLNGKSYSNAELLGALDLLARYNVPIFVYFSLNLPGESEAAARETVELATRIYDLYPPSLLKMLNSCHTIDPLSPMSLNPERFGIRVDMHTFADYYAYCCNTQHADPASRSEAHRGFRPADPQIRSLPAMADLWDSARLGRETSWWPMPPSW